MIAIGATNKTETDGNGLMEQNDLVKLGTRRKSYYNDNNNALMRTDLNNDERGMWENDRRSIDTFNSYLLEKVSNIYSDNDNDGLPDDSDGDGHLTTGNHYGVTDREADEDNDGLLNRQEFILKTNPTIADTDGDGLLDSEENGTGTWVNINNTGTNPLIADTDGDGFLDGAETNGTIFTSSTNTEPILIKPIPMPINLLIIMNI